MTSWNPEAPIHKSLVEVIFRNTTRVPSIHRITQVDELQPNQNFYFISGLCKVYNSHLVT